MTQASPEPDTQPNSDTTDTAKQEKYYLLDVRSIVGDCCLWWCPDGKGYTCNLEEAGLFTHEVAHRQRDTDVPVPEALAKSVAVTHVSFDRIRKHLKLGVKPQRCS